MFAMEYMRQMRQRYIKMRLVAGGVLLLLAAIVFLMIPKSNANFDENDKGKSDVLSSQSEPVPNVVTTEYEYTVSEGDTIISILQVEGGISYDESLNIAEEIDEVHDVTKIKLGQIFKFFFLDEDLRSITYDISKNESVNITANVIDFDVSREEIIYKREEVAKSGTITDSLYMAALGAGMTDNAIMNLANVFAWDVDFTSSIREGDYFSVIYDLLERDGEIAGSGAIKAARFVNDGQEFFAFSVQTDDGLKFFDEEGDSKQKMLLKTPLNFTRVSSGFTQNRKHPILGDFRKHRAIDFAAPTGTPIESVGDGTVTFAGWSGALGKYIKIQHGSGFETAYAHLSVISVKKGQKVKQSQIIGKVGSTGRSTGPHLHYEMYKNGGYINPLKADVPGGDPINEEFRVLLEAAVSKFKESL
jgi:murein DD-endopeptidase MepM/ murein hydrolase activator NlpD